MQQHTIGKRLAWAFGLMLALVVGMATVGLIATQRISYRTQVLYHDRAEPLQQLAELNQLVQRNQALVVDMLVNPGTQVQQHTLTFVQNTQRINSLWGQLNRPGLGGEEQAALQQWADARVAYLDQALAPANEAMANGRYDDAQELYLSKVAPQAGAMQMAMDALSGIKLRQAQAEFEATETINRGVAWSLPTMAVLAVLLGATLSWHITRSITQPLGRAVGVAQQVANGDLGTTVLVEGRDETAQLLAELRRMHQRLVGVVGQVRDGSLGMAERSAAIATGSHAVAEQAQTQAVHLDNTTSTVAGLSDQVAQNAQTAVQASALAQEARRAASDSSEVVSEVISTMQAIAQSSHRIADITTLIDSIAFQTNILALNAAVEAARAGDQGRGFAVVATEVRQLAQRSAHAAKDIRALIGESVERVATGSRLVDRAGASVQQITAQVDALSGLTEELRAASTAQTTGLGQVQAAIEELHQITRHNMSAVGLSATNAQALQQEAKALAASVGFFKLGAGSAGPEGLAAGVQPQLGAPT